MRALVLAAGLLGATAWAQAPRAGAAAPPAREGRVRLEVPFFPDRADQCGPSALASVLSFWGDSTPPARLREGVYRAALSGSLTVDLLLAAQAHGMSAEMLEGGLPRLKGELDAGRPVIALIDVGPRAWPVGHYVVVTGYDDARQGLYAHSGMKEDLFVPYRKFDARWERSQRWALALRPR